MAENKKNKQNNINGNGNKIRNVLFNEANIALAIATTVIVVTLFITSNDAQMRQDIALIKEQIKVIKNNDLEHLSTDVASVKDDTEYNEGCIEEMNLKLERIITLLDENNN